MNLLSDIKSRRLLYAKGVLFLVLGCMACGLILYENLNLRTTALLAIAVWAFCRFYYFLFYVLEHYAGRQQKYSGLWDVLVYLVRRK